MAYDNAPGKASRIPRTATSSANPHEVFQVALNIPPFWPEEPDIWFAKIEGLFANAGVVNNATKFNYVLGALDNKTSKDVKDIIIEPPNENKYKKLKTKLIQKLTISNENKLQQLVIHEELGDQKPSQFLRHLRNCAGVDTSEDFMRTIWVNRLPQNIQTVLAGQPDTLSLEVLADLADRVSDILLTPVASTSKATDDVLKSLTKEIADLKEQVQKLSLGKTKLHSKSQQPHRQPKSHKSNQKSNSASSTRSTSSYKKYPTCWYNGKFGEKATSCIRPCDFNTENSMKTE